MIGSLRGRLLDRGVSGELLVEVGGVGYRLHVTPGAAVSFGPEGSEVFVWVHHRVREDGQTLFGFADRAERECFEAILGAHGVGPALALAILSVHQPAALYRILADDDVAALCLVPGVGKKTAARLLIELKSRLDLPEGGAVPTATASGTSSLAPAAQVRADVRAALLELDYTAEEISEAMRTLPEADDASTLLRSALAALAAAR